MHSLDDCETKGHYHRLCHYSQKDYQKHVKAELSYLVSIWTREAEPKELRTICDWMNWVRLCYMPMLDFYVKSKLLTSRQVFDIDDSRFWNQIPL